MRRRLQRSNKFKSSPLEVPTNDIWMKIKKTLNSLSKGNPEPTGLLKTLPSIKKGFSASRGMMVQECSGILVFSSQCFKMKKRIRKKALKMYFWIKEELKLVQMKELMVKHQLLRKRKINLSLRDSKSLRKYFRILIL